MKTFKVVFSFMLAVVLYSNSFSTPNDNPPELSSNGFNDFGVTGSYIKLGIDSLGFIADYDLGYGLQYPIGTEHLAIGWWGDGYGVGYDSSHWYFASASYSNNGFNFISETDLSTTDDYIVEDVSQTNDGKIQVTHKYIFPKDKKFIILTVKIKNISNSVLNNIRYKKITDWDMDGTYHYDYYDYLMNSDGLPIMMAWETHYAGLALAPGTTATYIDGDWDSYWEYGVYISNSDPEGANIDGAAVFIFDIPSLNPNEEKTYTMFYLLGDSKDEIIQNYHEASSYLTSGSSIQNGKMYGNFTIGSWPNSAVVNSQIPCSSYPGVNPIFTMNWVQNYRYNYIVAYTLNSVTCYDDPAFDPMKPNVDFDTTIATLRGMMNYSTPVIIEIEESDGGEPGRNRDYVHITVKDMSNTVIFETDGMVTSGSVYAMPLH